MGLVLVYIPLSEMPFLFTSIFTSTTYSIFYLHFEPTLITIFCETRHLTYVRNRKICLRILIVYLVDKGFGKIKGFLPPRLHHPLAITTRKPLQKLTRLRGIGRISLIFTYLPVFGVCLVSVWCLTVKN